MSVSTPTVNDTGLADQGTSGSSLSNASATSLNGNEFLDLMMTQLENQDPLDPSSSDPTQYLTELAQMTDVEQETNTAGSTAASAEEQSVSQAIGLIGDSVSYTDATTGDKITGTVGSVQVTSSGATLTVGGKAGVSLGSITNVSSPAAASTAGATDTSTSSGSDESGS